MIALDPESAPLDTEEFERQLRATGHSYHFYHPFNVLLNAGGASAEQLRGWVANRFYYQVNIRVKDAAILANCADWDIHHEWVSPLRDQDGPGKICGGTEAWIRLGEALGLPASQLWSQQHALPEVRFTVDAYANFARRQPWQHAVCASLAELFAPAIHRERLAAWPIHYPWIEATGLEFFCSRISPASGDVEHALRITLEHFATRAAQARALEILRFKLDLVWSMLDGIQSRFGLAGDLPVSP